MKSIKVNQKIMKNQQEFSFSEDQKEENILEDNEKEEKNKTPENTDFASAMEELRELASELESGQLSLEEAMEKYEAGLDLISFCEERLEDAEILIEEIDDSDPENPEIHPKKQSNNE